MVGLGVVLKGSFFAIRGSGSGVHPATEMPASHNNRLPPPFATLTPVNHGSSLASRAGNLETLWGSGWRWWYEVQDIRDASSPTRMLVSLFLRVVR